MKLLVATRKGLFTVQKQDSHWRVADTEFLGDRVSLTLCDPRDGHWYAALDHGHFGPKLHRSEDQGGSWTEITCPAYPAKPADAPELTGAGQPDAWHLKLIWELACGGDDRPGTLWCGTIPGGLFRSSDRGASWQLIDSLWTMPDRLKWFGGGADDPGMHSICVDPRDSDHVIVGVSCGGVWETRDNGLTWAVQSNGLWAAYMPPELKFDGAIQDPHRIAMCASDPDSMWIQHHNGVFKTRDGGATWSEIDSAGPSTFGFATAVHPRDPDIAFFAPAVSDEHRIPVDGKLVITRTRDGGRHFDVLSNGLPSEYAYDLIFRHALDLHPNGDTLAFGSTTGSLWISEDQGDSFTAISTHLPPIYSVRFAG